MKKRGEKWIGYFDFLDTLKEPGCPLCNRIKKLSWNFLDSLYYESVTDVGTRVKLREAKGFCNFHAWMSTEIRNSGSGIAIIYKDLLDSEINQLSKWLKKRKSSTQRKSFRVWKKDLDAWLLAWNDKATCPICESIKTYEQIDIGTLLDYIDEEAFSKKFKKSSGVCIRHLIKIIQTSDQHPNLLSLVEKQLEKYSSLSEELGEFIRKMDYRFSKEPRGSEVDSWRRVLEQFAGHREIFGNEMNGKG
jgi:hypothetical protein